jgi:hypothetical protein
VSQKVCSISTQAEDKIVPSSTKEEEDDDEDEDEDGHVSLHASDAATGPIPVGKPGRLGRKEKGGGKVELDAKKVTGKPIA